MSKKDQLLSDKQHRDDMHALTRDGVPINTRGKLPRMSSPDRPHIFADSRGGNIIPASKLKRNGAVWGVAHRTFRLGPAHSHPSDSNHRDHYLEEMSNTPKDLISRFRQASKDIRRQRNAGKRT